MELKDCREITRKIAFLSEHISEIAASKKRTYFIQKILMDHISTIRNDTHPKFRLLLTEISWLHGLISVERRNYCLSHPKWYYKRQFNVIADAYLALRYNTDKNYLLPDTFLRELLCEFGYFSNMDNVVCIDDYRQARPLQHG